MDKAGDLPGLALLVFLWVEPISGQAICSAPHSSPTLAQSGSLSTLPRGGGWLQASLYGQSSDRFFSPEGDRQPFLADSRFNTRSLFLTGAFGVLDGFELWAQVPVQRLIVESAGGNSENRGFGDFRLAVRVGPAFLGVDLPVTLRFGAKLPGSEFPVDATVLPLTEGQRDWEATLESGYGVQEFPLYLMAWLGYRWREENVKAARDPGDEVFGHLAVGGALGSLSWEVAGDGLWGRPPTAQGFVLEGDARRLVQVLPALGYPVGPGRIELSAQIPVLGKNLPVAPGLSLGYRMTWGLQVDPIATLLDLLEDSGR